MTMIVQSDMDIRLSARAREINAGLEPEVPRMPKLITLAGNNIAPPLDYEIISASARRAERRAVRNVSARGLIKRSQ